MVFVRVFLTKSARDYSTPRVISKSLTEWNNDVFPLIGRDEISDEKYTGIRGRNTVISYQ